MRLSNTQGIAATVPGYIRFSVIAFSINMFFYFSSGADIQLWLFLFAR